MKFTDSPVIELPVHNSLISLQQDNRSMHVGTSVWPCSLVLVKFIDHWAPPTTNDKPLLPTAWSRARAKLDSDYLLGLSTKYLSLRNLPKCRHCVIQARESDPNQSSTANKVLAITDVLVTAENPSATAASTTIPSSKSDVPSPGLPGRSSPVRETRGAPEHPNVNKFAFSDEALNLVCEAWTVLSDSDKRAQYGAEIDKTAEVAFWTLCPYCYYMYEYEKVYEDCCLRCQNCRRRFRGVAVNSPRKTEKNRETETEYSVCWSYFPLWIPDEKKGWEKRRH